MKTVVLPVLVAFQSLLGCCASAQQVEHFVFDGAGGLRFLEYVDGKYNVVWTISCREKFKDCRATSANMVLWVDHNGDMWLQSSLYIESTPQIRIKNHYISLDSILTSPISESAASILSNNNAYIEFGDDEQNIEILKIPYISYIHGFLNKSIASGEMPQNKTNQENFHIFSKNYRFINYLSEPNGVKIINRPFTKPQVEFAIKSQTQSN